MYMITECNLIIAKGRTRGDCIEQLACSTFPTVITIETKGESQLVTVSNEVWVNKSIVLPKSYNSEYCRKEILNDIAEKVCRMNGYNLVKITE